MPWKENRTMDLRVQLIQDYEEGHSIAALAAIYGVSRKTVYKWLARYAAEGAAGLSDHPRAPQHSPHRVGEELIAQIIAVRQRWRWGPRKLRVKLAAAHPEVDWPAESTIGEVLKRAGLTHPRKLRVRTPPYAQPFAAVEAPHQTWCADFKGWFRTGDGTRCDPLTITDAHSRYLLRCHIVAKTDTTHVAAIFDAAFREHGLPLVIHTDNGVPFASRAPGGLSRLSLRWVKLGITPERSRPGSPQDNGRHERMHSTLQQATLHPPERTPARQQQAFDAASRAGAGVRRRPVGAARFPTRQCDAAWRAHVYQRDFRLRMGGIARARRALPRSFVRTGAAGIFGHAPAHLSSRPGGGSAAPIEARRACGNAGRWKAWKSKGRISTLSPVLGNRPAISTFPHARRFPL
jgi:putative transposase